MSFLSIFTTLGHDLKVGLADVAKVATPLVPTISLIPVVGPIASTVISAITAVEGLVTTPSTGAAKKSAVVTIVNAVHPGLDQNVLSSSIDGLVTAFNAVQNAVTGISALTSPKA